MDMINELTGRANEFATIEGNQIVFFLQQANQDILAINNLISEYNSKTTPSEKEALLKEIENASQLISKTYPPSFLAYSADFSEEVLNKLFTNIKNERKKLNLLSAHADSSLAHIIENMSSDKITRLMEIFNKGHLFNADELTALYNSADEKEDYDNFQAFLSNTSIKFLGGGNSLNFKITEANGKSLVLKLEHRLDQPALIEEHLKSGILKDVITNSHVKRQGTFTYFGTYDIRSYPLPTILIKNRLYVDIQPHAVTYTYLDGNHNQQTSTIDSSHPKFNSLVGLNYTNLRDYLPNILKITDDRGHTQPVKRTVSRSLVVTDFCDGGDLQYHGENIKKSNDKINSALNIYTQMGEVLTALTDNKCTCPDMKNTNWLLDENNVLKIADTKSFIHINDKGNIDLSAADNKWGKLIQTKYVSPPEMKLYFQNNTISADQIHVYMLGKNLYQYLTACSCESLEKSIFSFNSDVFKTREGKQLEQLIKSMISTIPHARISTVDALETLKKIQQNMIRQAQQAEEAAINRLKTYEQLVERRKEMKKSNAKLLEEISNLQLGKKDIKMVEFVEHITHQLDMEHDILRLTKIHEELKTILVKNTDPGISSLKEHLISLRGSLSYYLGNYRIIKDAILNVPIKERGDINNPNIKNNDAITTVQKVLNKYCDKNWLKSFYKPTEQTADVDVSKSFKQKYKTINEPKNESIFNPRIKKQSDQE